MADVGTGTSIGFGTSGFTADVLSIGWDGIDREPVEISHLLTTVWQEHMPVDLTDPGTISITIQFDPDDIPPINGATEVITVTFPLPAGQTTPADWEANGFVIGMTPAIDLETVMESTITIKMTGAITFTPSA